MWIRIMFVFFLKPTAENKKLWVHYRSSFPKKQWKYYQGKTLVFHHHYRRSSEKGFPFLSKKWEGQRSHEKQKNLLPSLIGILKMVFDDQHIAVPSIIKTCSHARAWHERVRENKHHISNLYQFRPSVAKQHLVIKWDYNPSETGPAPSAPCELWASHPGFRMFLRCLFNSFELVGETWWNNLRFQVSTHFEMSTSTSVYAWPFRCSHATSAFCEFPKPSEETRNSRSLSSSHERNRRCSSLEYWDEPSPHFCFESSSNPAVTALLNSWDSLNSPFLRQICSLLKCSAPAVAKFSTLPFPFILWKKYTSSSAPFSTASSMFLIQWVHQRHPHGFSSP